MDKKTEGTKTASELKLEDKRQTVLSFIVIHWSERDCSLGVNEFEFDCMETFTEHQTKVVNGLSEDELDELLYLIRLIGRGFSNMDKDHWTARRVTGFIYNKYSELVLYSE